MSSAWAPFARNASTKPPSANAEANRGAMPPAMNTPPIAQHRRARDRPQPHRRSTRTGATRGRLRLRRRRNAGRRRPRPRRARRRARRPRRRHAKSYSRTSPAPDSRCSAVTRPSDGRKRGEKLDLLVVGRRETHVPAFAGDDARSVRSAQHVRNAEARPRADQQTAIVRSGRRVDSFDRRLQRHARGRHRARRVRTRRPRSRCTTRRRRCPAAPRTHLHRCASARSSGARCDPRSDRRRRGTRDRSSLVRPRQRMPASRFVDVSCAATGSVASSITTRCAGLASREHGSAHACRRCRPRG